MIRVSAPGKIVLSGEYAVLDGAPAICMAVDCRAAVTVVESGDDYHSVTAPGYSNTEGRFTAGDGQLSWRQGREEYELVEAAWYSLQLDIDTPVHIELDTRPFHTVGGDKVGLGSSAALAVAVVAALVEYSGSSQDIAAAAQLAHRALQGGKGSGVDVACSATGGLIAYRMKESATRSLDWPAGLSWAVLWSGVTSSTAEKIARLAEAAAHASRDALAAASERMAQAWSSADSRVVLQEYPAYCDALQRFSVDHELGIFDAGHDLVAKAAARHDLVYKPCGAGGGDIGIVLASEDDALAAFANEVVESGFRKLDTGLDYSGVILD